MPRRDGTGPASAGSTTGRGFGLCTTANTGQCRTGQRMRYGSGMGCRHGLGRGFAINQNSSKTQEELLNEQKTMLQNRLEVIDKQLESL